MTYQSTSENNMNVTDFQHNSSLTVPRSNILPVISFCGFAVGVSPQGPAVLRRQKKDLPQSVFTIPPELDVSLVLEFVG